MRFGTILVHGKYALLTITLLIYAHSFDKLRATLTEMQHELVESSQLLSVSMHHMHTWNMQSIFRARVLAM